MGEGRTPGDPVAATERYLKGFRCGEADLCGVSPVSVDGDPRYDGALLAKSLYPTGEFLNFVTEFKAETDAAGKLKARPIGKGRTVERDALVAEWELGGVAESQAGGWLRMNPVDGQGIDDANVTAFRFALLECNTLPLELQWSLFAKLPLPVAAIRRAARAAFSFAATNGWSPRKCPAACSTAPMPGASNRKPSSVRTLCRARAGSR